MLSGSDWISNWSDDKDGVAEYVIEVPATGHYTLWIRANPVGTRLAYPIDSGKWTPIDRPIKLKDVTIQSSNDYGTVMIVALDNQPLTESKRVLVQVGTTARPTGWIERETTFQGDDGKQTYHGKQVVDTGTMPWAIADAQITLTVANSALTAATQLDINGNPRTKLKTTVQGQAVRLHLPKDALYVVLEAK